MMEQDGIMTRKLSETEKDPEMIRPLKSSTPPPQEPPSKQVPPCGSTANHEVLMS